jgi:hypothetical protein
MEIKFMELTEQLLILSESLRMENWKSAKEIFFLKINKVDFKLVILESIKTLDWQFSILFFLDSTIGFVTLY